MYRVYKNGNRKIFVETSSLKFARSLAREEEKRGNIMEIRQLKNGRWYKVKERQ